MRSEVFNTTFENMLRVLLLADTLNVPANVDRLAALDFICIYGKKCKVLDKNLHGDIMSAGKDRKNLEMLVDDLGPLVYRAEQLSCFCLVVNNALEGGSRTLPTRWGWISLRSWYANVAGHICIFPKRTI